MSSQILPLVIVLPIIAGVLSSALGMRGRRRGWEIASVAVLLEAGLVLSLTTRILNATPLTYPVGGFPPPYGIELVVDGLAVVLLVVNAVIGLGVLLYMRGASRSNHFFGVFLFLIAGVAGIGVTGDLFTMYVFFEITGISAYVLVATGEGGDTVYAAFKYLLLGTVGASFFLLGVGYLYVATGTLNMADIAGRIGTVGYSSPVVLAAFVFILVGLSIKIPLVPVHTWLPDAHSKAPAGVSAVISAIVTAAAAYALARVLFSAFTVRFLNVTPSATAVILTLAGAGVLAGTTLAIRQSTVKRMLAFSTISQFGLVVIGIGLVNASALTGSVIHLAGHALMKAGLFLAAGVIANRFHATTVDEYAGLGKRAPVLTGAFVVLALTMVGIPPGVGFFGKWYIALGAVKSQAWPIAIVVFVSTLLTLGYFMRLFERMYLNPPTIADGAGTSESPSNDRLKLAVIILTAIGAVALGLLSNTLVEMITPTIETLLTP